MEELRNQLEKELVEFERIKKAAEADFKNAPSGTLRISKKPKFEQYYWRTDPKDTRGKYIKKSEGELIRSLAQKDYAKKMLLLLEPAIEAGKKSLVLLDKVTTEKNLEEVYQKLSPARQKLVVPYVESDEEYIVRWLEEKTRKKAVCEKFPEISTEIYTEKGECVRSKVEPKNSKRVLLGAFWDDG